MQVLLMLAYEQQITILAVSLRFCSLPAQVRDTTTCMIGPLRGSAGFNKQTGNLFHLKSFLQGLLGIKAGSKYCCSTECAGNRS